MEMGIIDPHLGYRIDFRMFGGLIRNPGFRIKGGYAASFAARMIIHQRCSPFISISRKLDTLHFASDLFDTRLGLSRSDPSSWSSPTRQ